jgi:hypothetical protein
LVLLGLTLASAQILFAGAFLISPLIPFLFTWFYLKPSRVLSLSNSYFVSFFRIILIIAILYPLLTGEASIIYENFYSSDSGTRELQYSYPLAGVTVFFITPVMFTITLLELFGCLLLLRKYQKSRDLATFNKNMKIRFGEAVVYTSLIALALFLIFFYLIT